MLLFPLWICNVIIYLDIISSAPIGQGYGLTETCAGGTFSEYDDTSVGRVGAPLPCSFIKVKCSWSYCLNILSGTNRFT